MNSTHDRFGIKSIETKMTEHPHTFINKFGNDIDMIGLINVMCCCKDFKLLNNMFLFRAIFYSFHLSFVVWIVFGYSQIKFFSALHYHFFKYYLSMKIVKIEITILYR